MAEDVEMEDADASGINGNNTSSKVLVEKELNDKYPNRPHNHSKTLPFHDLFVTLFNPLRDNQKKPVGPVIARKKLGRHAAHSQTPQEARRSIIERFISRWKKEVGNDIFPAFRLIIPEKDKDRGMYGLKEKTIAKLLIRILKIDKNSTDAQNLMNWKLPGQTITSVTAGDFAGRCYDVISKRPLRTKVGDMTIEEVNERLDQLSFVGKEDEQVPIMEEFYERMNAEEMMWLIRMILRQMKIGATERTFFDIWHPDAARLFNISSNLRRVCWELYDLDVRLDAEESQIAPMECFQPQLAQFQMITFEKMVQRMRPTEDDPTFWVEEKLDGERIQLHMIEDENHPGGKRFCFWSRKAKDYTSMYGDGFEDPNSSLTRHLKEAFHEGVYNIILDGEMITWDYERDKIVAFGTLKTAAIAEQNNPWLTGERPVFRAFDILYCNDKPLTQYTLRKRRETLEAAVKPVHRRLEIHTYTEAKTAAEIEPLLRKVVAEASEGLVMKNPRSAYELNQRNDDWIKVKPDYMKEYGESLDLIVIGGYFGSGHRGGFLSSFLCGLRVDQHHIDNGADPMKCYSFCKVGGGFSRHDYADIRKRTDGNWHDWDPKKPPTEYVELAGGDKQYERPDMWIRPDESVVISVKAASVAGSPQFRMKVTLRFPRFKQLRHEKDWKGALSISEFIELRARLEKEKEEKDFTHEEKRRKRMNARRKPSLVPIGAEENVDDAIFEVEESTGIFSGLNFFIMTESIGQGDLKKSKAELEAFVKHHGGKIFQSHNAADKVFCIADRNLPKVAALQRHGTNSIFRPSWLFDCVNQAKRDQSYGRTTPLLLPWEPRHIFFAREEDAEVVSSTTDQWGDAYARDFASVQELGELLESMPSKFEDKYDSELFVAELEEAGCSLRDLGGWLFKTCVVNFTDGQEDTMDVDGVEDNNIFLQTNVNLAASIVKFGAGQVTENFNDANITHVVLVSSEFNASRNVRELLSRRSPLPRLVTIDWVLHCWKEGTLLDEEKFMPS